MLVPPEARYFSHLSPTFRLFMTYLRLLTWLECLPPQNAGTPLPDVIQNGGSMQWNWGKMRVMPGNSCLVDSPQSRSERLYCEHFAEQGIMPRRARPIPANRHRYSRLEFVVRKQAATTLYIPAREIRGKRFREFKITRKTDILSSIFISYGKSIYLKNWF
jgi:hypothetical protein